VNIGFAEYLDVLGPRPVYWEEMPVGRPLDEREWKSGMSGPSIAPLGRIFRTHYIPSLSHIPGASAGEID